MVAIRSAQPEQSQALLSLDEPMSGMGWRVQLVAATHSANLSAGV
jgi:hypothetical protein